MFNWFKKTIESLKDLNKLRILFLHGNPISLLVDYRLYVVDSLDKLNVLDDITITAEERFRARHFSKSNEHPKDYSQFQITFGTIQNVPMSIPLEVCFFSKELVLNKKLILEWMAITNSSI
jgi:hypothetical protein